MLFRSRIVVNILKEFSKKLLTGKVPLLKLYLKVKV